MVVFFFLDGVIYDYNILYPLVNCYITLENHHWKMGKSTISMGIFNSYVRNYQGKPTFQTCDKGPSGRRLDFLRKWFNH